MMMMMMMMKFVRDAEDEIHFCLAVDAGEVRSH